MEVAEEEVVAVVVVMAVVVEEEDSETLFIFTSTRTHCHSCSVQMFCKKDFMHVQSRFSFSRRHVDKRTLGPPQHETTDTCILMQHHAALSPIISM